VAGDAEQVVGCTMWAGAGERVFVRPAAAELK